MLKAEEESLAINSADAILAREDNEEVELLYIPNPGNRVSSSFNRFAAGPSSMSSNDADEGISFGSFMV
jgi:hypothetical protein